MPTYEFKCPFCYRVVSEFRWFSQADDAPPKCAEGHSPVEMEKLITGGSRTVMKGGTGAGRAAGKYDR